MGLLYGRAGRLTALYGGFRPGQWVGNAELQYSPGLWSGSPSEARVEVVVRDASQPWPFVPHFTGTWRMIFGMFMPGLRRPGGQGVFLTPPGHLLTPFHTILIVEFGGHLPTLPSF